MYALDTLLGGMFVALGATFALGLIPRLATRFYPASPGLRVRLAAPLIFAALAAACFAGLAVPTLSAVVILGLAQIVLSRGNRRKRTPTG